MLLDVGRVGRPHGVRGEVVVTLTTDRTERLAPGSTLQSSAGPLVVGASRPHQGKFLVRFVGVDGRAAAEALGGTVLRAEALTDPDTLWVHELVGARVCERDGTDRGAVVEVQEAAAADLLVLDTGALVPVTFVADHVPGERVVIDPPEGLFDL